MCFEVGKLYKLYCFPLAFKIAKNPPEYFTSEADWVAAWNDAHNVDVLNVPLEWSPGTILLCVKCEKCVSKFPLADNIKEPEYYIVNFLDPKGRTVEPLTGRSKDCLTSAFKRIKE